MPVLQLQQPALLSRDLLLLPANQKFLVVDDLLAPRHSLPPRVGLYSLLPRNALVEVDVGAVEVHAHLHPRGLHLGPLGHRFIRLPQTRQLRNLLLSLPQPPRQAARLRLRERQFLFQLEDL